jgi:hypothetical protein
MAKNIGAQKDEGIDRQVSSYMKDLGSEFVSAGLLDVVGWISALVTLKRASEEIGKTIEANRRVIQWSEIQSRHSHPPFEATTTQST